MPSCSYNGLLIAEDPNDPEADPEELQIPGTINVFVGPDYKPYSTIDPPDEGKGGARTTRGTHAGRGGKGGMSAAEVNQVNLR